MSMGAGIQRCHGVRWGLPHPVVVEICACPDCGPVPRIQILLMLTAVVLSGLAAPVTGARASTSETPALVATIDVGAGTTPYGIAVTPDGSKVFVSNSTAGSVSVIDTATRAVMNTITSNIGSTPVGIAINPTGTTAYVGNFNAGFSAGNITSIDIATSTTAPHNVQAATGQQCNWILNLTASNDGTRLFVACQDDSQVQVLDLPALTSGSVLASTTNNCFPTDSAVTSDDATLVVAVNGPATGDAPCDPAIRNTALIIDVATGPIGNTYLPATNGAFSVAISPTSGLAYLAGRNSGAISVVNPATRTSARSDIVVGGDLTDIVISPDGSQAIVSVIDEDVVKFIDLDTGTVTHTVGVGGTDPQSIALSRDGRFLYTANRSGSVGVIQVPVPLASSTASDGTSIYALQLSAGPAAICSTTELIARRNTWTELPASDACAASEDNADAVLLGWATSVSFPIDIAQRQVDNGWGAYETFDGEGRLTGVFIPAGGATLISASGTLHAIWSRPVSN
jgi:YVTN family beta-propeller protein